MEEGEKEWQESLKAARKNASQVALLLGGIALAVGALVCLLYLVLYQPWKMENPRPAASSNAETK